MSKCFMSVGTCGSPLVTIKTYSLNPLPTTAPTAKPSISMKPSISATPTATPTVTPTVTPTASPTQSPTAIYIIGDAMFYFTGGVQYYNVPDDTYRLDIIVCGAPGGSYNGQANGGYTSATYYTTNVNSTLFVYVGEQGTNEQGAMFNGGGAGYPSNGGGASDIRVNGTSLNNRILVAGGGGGYNSYAGTAGPGGGLNGGNAADATGGGATGGSQTSGGLGDGCAGCAGGFGFGGR